MHNRSLKPRGGGGHPITASPADPFLGRSRSVCFLRPHLGFKVAITLWMLSSSPPAAQPRHCAFWDPILPVLGPILPGLVGSGFDGAEGFVIPLRPREGGVFFSGTVMVAAMPDYQAAVDDFVTKLRRRSVLALSVCLLLICRSVGRVWACAGQLNLCFLCILELWRRQIACDMEVALELIKFGSCRCT